MKAYKYISVTAFILLAACANRGMGPQGGAKDETPPKVVKETPENGALNFTDKHIEIVFDEYIQLDNVANNVFISPPQQRPPEVKAYGKKLYVNFDSDLQDSTTYTIDFGAAICDNNEKNALTGYSFAFSTYDVFDSLQIAGEVLNAADLNPISGVLAGIHTSNSDTALSRLPFMRAAKTNSGGEFKIRNVHPATYMVYALNDVSKDYMYQPGEGLAFYDSLVTPSCRVEVLPDTVWKDSVTIDTIKYSSRTLYSPDSLLLIYFTENKQKQYFQRVTRDEQHLFRLTFAAAQDSLPELRLLDTTVVSPFLCQANLNKDTIVYWMTDSALIQKDTLTLELRYMKTDSVYELQPETDTIRAIYRAPRITAQAKARIEKEKANKKLQVSHNAQSPFDVYKPISLSFDAPLYEIHSDSIHLYMMRDTVPVKVDYELACVDSAHIMYEIRHQWKAETEYRLEIDSAAATDMYGHSMDKMRSQFKIRSLDEYSTLILKIEPYDERAVLQVLDQNDKPVRTLRAKAEGTRFEYLAPESYYLRMYIDLNGDSLWTTGDYLTHRLPEPVYYFTDKLTLRANWDVEETFEYLKVPIKRQKPKELRKDANQKK